MTTEFAPGLLLIIGAIPVPFIRGKARSIYMLALPILGILQLTHWTRAPSGSCPLWDLNKSTLASIN